MKTAFRSSPWAVVTQKHQESGFSKEGFMMGLMSEIMLFSDCKESSSTKGGDAP
jgi:hypothetical protein